MEPSRRLLVFLLVGAVVASAQHYDQTTPVPILKQINRHNDDGSYSYGYEAADGSYKIETKHPTGEVLGKYGYVDDTGSVREVEYGASRRGFEPAGTGINVAPPTLNSNNNYYKGNAVGEDNDDGQYHEDPSVYYKNPSYNSAPRKVFNNPPPQQNYNPPQQNYNPPQQNYNPPQQNYNYNNNPRPSYNSNYNSYNAEPSYNNYNPPQQQYFPKVDPNQFRGHPATNFDVYSGSYSVNYSGRR